MKKLYWLLVLLNKVKIKGQPRKGRKSTVVVVNREVVVRKLGLNPTGVDGKPLTCRICGSYRHFMKDCPYSWENITIRLPNANFEGNPKKQSAQNVFAEI